MTFRAMNSDGVEIGLTQLDSVIDAIQWAASIGVRGVVAIERKDGDSWVNVWKYTGASSM